MSEIKNNDLSIANPCFLVSGKTRIKKVAEKYAIKVANAAP
jgi:hypothetical protein